MQQHPQILMQTFIWSQENHGLFDYEAKDLKSTSFVIQNNKTITLQNNTIMLIDGPLKEALGNIQFEQNEINFKCNPKATDAYLKLTHQKEQLKYVLQPGDLLKLGRIEFFVSEMFTETDESTVFAPDHFNLDKHIKVDLGGNHQCKFCLMEDAADIENPYLSQLCKCQGHMQDVHYHCLKEWINSRIKKHETYNTVQYEWDRALECDVCKEPIPARIYLNLRPEPYHLIQIERPPFPYMILEQITRSQNISKSLTLIHSANQVPIPIGRGHTCEIRCQDISVSRNHAAITYQDKWQIHDLGSKFGTLQIVHEQIQLTTEIKEIQIGRILLKLHVEYI